MTYRTFRPGVLMEPKVAVAGESQSDSGSAVTGPAIDRYQPSTGHTVDSLYYSARVTVGAEATANGSTAKLAVHLEHADSSTGSWSDFNTFDGSTAVVVPVDSTGFHTGFGDWKIAGAKRYVRAVVSPTFGSTGTIKFSAHVDLLGGDQAPS